MQLSTRGSCKEMARKLTSTAVACLLNGDGGALLGTGDDDAILDVPTDYFTDNTHEETEGKTTFTLYYIKKLCIT